MKIKSQRTMQKHILNWYDKATSEEIEAGKEWYSEANAFCQLFPNVWGMSQIISILSPQVDWNTNLKNAELIYNAAYNGDDVLSIKIFASELQKVNAASVLRGEYEIPYRARKTDSFAANIYNPRGRTSVTIDRHAVKVALNDLKAGGVQLTTKQYDTIADCYKKVASKLDLIPCELQAITWLTYKRVVNR